jgi:hypothetical protein
MELLGMAVGPLIVTIIRLLVPFTIFRWPFWGGVATMLVDSVDIILVFWIGQGDFKSYHRTDKALDSYFLVFMAVYSWIYWKGLEKKIALGLFAWRMIGFVAFEITGLRWLLLLFADLFMWWWLFVAGRDQFKPGWTITRKRTGWVIGLMIGPKLLQETILHIWELKPVQIMSDFGKGLLNI